MSTTPTASEIYWHPCPDTNRAFLCVAGHDNNLAEVFPVESAPGFLSAHDNAARIAKAIEEHSGLIAERDRLRDAGELCRDALERLAASEGTGSDDALKAMQAALTGTTPSESARLRECNAELASVLGEYVNVGAVPMWLQKKGLAALDKYRA